MKVFVIGLLLVLNVLNDSIMFSVSGMKSIMLKSVSVGLVMFYGI